jgi:hypothetical protein
MVEGDDRTDRSSTCGGSGDYGREPNGPEKLDWYECPKRPPKLARDRNPFPAPGLTTLHKVREQVSTRTLRRGPVAASYWAAACQLKVPKLRSACLLQHVSYLHSLGR